MSRSPEERERAYASASEARRDLYGNILLGEALSTVSSGLGNNYRDFVGVIGDIILGLEPQESAYKTLTTRYALSDLEARKVIDVIVNKVPSELLTLGANNVLTEQRPTAAPLASTSATPMTSTPPSSPIAAPHVPVARVMPHSASEAQHDPRASTELPNALLQNLKASLMHSVPEEPLEGTNPAPSYNAMLGPKPPMSPPSPPNT